MVGVPGRSKGCHTCRRRKIKCDLAKPNCERCTRSGRECEGYARGAVFLNRTPHGMLKREHLDEAELRSKSQIVASSDDSSAEAAIISAAPAAYANRSGGSIERRSRPPLHQDLYAGITDRKVLSDGLKAYYVNRFVPLDSRYGEDTCGVWPLKALGMADRGEALDNAFAALAFNRAGRDYADQNLVVLGREAYGKALRAVSKSLLNPRAIYSDQLLAACNLLKTYEIQEATGNSTNGHDSHIQGLTKIIQERGEEALQTEHNRFLVNEVRFSAMIVAIQYRKRNPFGDARWSPKSWKSSSDLFQSLYDNGFTLAGLTEDMDVLAKNSKSENAPGEVVRITKGLLAVHDELKKWHRDALQKVRFAMDWSDPDSLPGPRAYESPYDRLDEEEPAMSKIKMSMLFQRLIMMDFWTLRMVVCWVLKVFEQDMTTMGLKRMGPQRSLDQMLLQLVENVAKMAPLCLSDDCGIYGQSRTIYALRVSIIPTRMIPTPRAETLRKQIEGLIAIVSSKAARNVAAKSTVSEAWKNTLFASDHQFVART